MNRRCIIDGKKYRVRYTARKGAELVYVIDIGKAEKGPAGGEFGDEVPVNAMKYTAHGFAMETAGKGNS